MSRPDKVRKLYGPDFIAKKTVKPSALLNPVPVVMCTCGDMIDSDIVTIAWCGTVNSDPPMISVSVRKSRYSHGLISASGKLCVNLVSQDLVKAADFCGVRSGRDTDKFSETGLTKVESPLYAIPMIGESPVNLECSVKQTIELGSHDMFLCNIDAVYVAEKLFDAKGAIDMSRAGLAAYSHGEYYALSGILGFFGYSVAGEDALKRRKR